MRPCSPGQTMEAPAFGSVSGLLCSCTLHFALGTWHVACGAWHWISLRCQDSFAFSLRTMAASVFLLSQVCMFGFVLNFCPSSTAALCVRPPLSLSVSVSVSLSLYLYTSISYYVVRYSLILSYLILSFIVLYYIILHYALFYYIAASGRHGVNAQTDARWLLVEEDRGARRRVTRLSQFVCSSDLKSNIYIGFV